jgi:high-affinity iron transporter
MLPSFLLSLREGLEAALILSIVLGALGRLNRMDLKPIVWRGAMLAIALSLAVGIGLTSLGMELVGQAERIFEGIALTLAAGILTWMILWMQRHGREVKRQLEDRTRLAVLHQGANALFFLAFMAVFREGVELALFLLAASLATGPLGSLVGGALGIGVAIILGWALFATTSRLNVRHFFQITSVLLIFFAAGLVGLGIHELNEAGWIPAIIEPVYDTNPLIDEGSQVGQVLKALFGYNGNPSLTEIIAYTGYFVTLGWVTLKNQRKQSSVQAQPA